MHTFSRDKQVRCLLFGERPGESSYTGLRARIAASYVLARTAKRAHANYAYIVLLIGTVVTLNFVREEPVPPPPLLESGQILPLRSDLGIRVNASAFRGALVEIDFGSLLSIASASSLSYPSP